MELTVSSVEKIVLVERNELSEVNELLSKGWKVKNIIPFTSTAAAVNDYRHGYFGAYVVLIKDIK